MIRTLSFLCLLILAAPIAVAAEPNETPHFAKSQPTPSGAFDLRIPVDGEARKVAATLYTPTGPGPFPTLITALGASARSRNSGNWPKLATEFARAGFALLVYDQPGTGDTPGVWREAPPLRESVDEIKSIAAFLSRHPKVHGNEIGVIGWSRGGWTGPWAAVESPHISFVIANSAPAVSPNEANIHQRGQELVDQGYSAEEVAEIEALRRLAWTYYGTGRGYEEARAAWQAARERSWFKRLGLRPEIASPEQIKSANFEFYREGTYDPAPVLAQLTKPVLVYLGSADRHIPVDESIAGWRKAFAESGNPDATIVLLANAGHALKLVNGKEKMSAAEGHAAFANLIDHPQYMPTLLNWLRRHM